MQDRTLWQNISLAAFDGQLLFDLFTRIQAGQATDPDWDRYSRQLMVLISANFTRMRFLASCRKHRLDPEDVASDILLFLVKRTPTLRLRSPCPAVLAEVLNTTIYRRIITVLRASQFPQELCVSEFCDDETWLDMSPATRDSGLAVPNLAIRLKGSEDQVLQGVPGDIFALSLLYRYLCRQLLRQNTLLTHAQLPSRLRKRVNLEQHAIVSYRINKLVREYAQSL